MLTVTVTTLDGARHVDETFGREGVRALLEEHRRVERLVLDVGGGRLVVVPWQQVAEVLIEGAE
jgi:hypothetical protein